MRLQLAESVMGGIGSGVGWSHRVCLNLDFLLGKTTYVE